MKYYFTTNMNCAEMLRRMRVFIRARMKKLNIRVEGQEGK